MELGKMTKTQILMICLLGFALAGCDQGSVLNSKQLEPDNVSRIDSAGWDLRVYEFTPNTAPQKQCLFVAGTKKGGLVCFDKEEN